MARRRLLVLSASLACLAGAATAGGEASPATDATQAVRAVQRIVPQRLFIGDESRPECATVVEVQEPEQACAQHTCLKLFDTSNKAALRPGQRAIHVGSCSAAQARGYLLWGSSSILVLQSDRQGPGLWEQATRGKTRAINLETEGSHGIVSRSQRGFTWKEEPG